LECGNLFPLSIWSAAIYRRFLSSLSETFSTGMFFEQAFGVPIARNQLHQGWETMKS